MDCKNFGEIWIVRCSSLVFWKMSNGRLFTLSNIGVGNVFKTTTTTCCAMCWASIVHWPYLHRSCAHMSHVQCPVSYVHCKHCPTLQAMSYIANFVLHCRHCPTLKSQCPEKTVQLLVIRFSTSSQYQLKGVSFTSCKAAFGYFWNFLDFFLLSICVRNVQNSTKMPYKDYSTRNKIFLAVSKYIFWDGVGFLRLAGLQMVLYKANLSAQKKQQ